MYRCGLEHSLTPRPRGHLAGILVPTECDLTLDHLAEAMDRSFETRRMVKLQRRAAVKHNTVFCDLDGVLADFDHGVLEVTGRRPNEQPEKRMWQRILARQVPTLFGSFGELGEGRF